jgi:hypothetical protein
MLTVSVIPRVLSQGSGIQALQHSCIVYGNYHNVRYWGNRHQCSMLVDSYRKMDYGGATCDHRDARSQDTCTLPTDARDSRHEAPGAAHYTLKLEEVGLHTGCISWMLYQLMYLSSCIILPPFVYIDDVNFLPVSMTIAAMEAITANASISSVDVTRYRWKDVSWVSDVT